MLLRAAADRLGQPVPRLAAEQVARPALLQPYRVLHKLFNKESVRRRARLAAVPRRAVRRVRLHGAGRARSSRRSSTDLPLAPAADAIALVGLFALARVFISLAAMDVGTAFGTLGARREMLIGFLAEPALLMVLFSRLADLAVDRRSPTIVETLAHRELAIYPSLAFAGVAFTMVLARRERAHAGRQPGDAPRADDDPRGDDPRVLGRGTWR